MTDLSALPPARVFTTWGTVLYVDAASGQLRHGAIETSAANTVFVAEPTSTELRRQGWMMHVSGETLDPIACGALSCRSVSGAKGGDPPATPTLLELVPLERGLIAFRAGGVFLCAQPDGRIDLVNPVCSTWECFLASEDWCSTTLTAGNGHPRELAGPAFDKRRIAGFIVDSRLRATANAKSKATKILIYGYPAWSHGRVYYDVCKHLHSKGYIVDIINWQMNHADHMAQLISYYDLFISALDGVRTLVEVYGVAAGKVIGLSHHALDIRTVIEQMGVEIFDQLAGYGVVGYQLFDASVIFGVKRHPLVVHLGVNFDELCAEIPDRLATVGYAGSFSQQSVDGIELKRGVLVEEAAREAGLEFKIAGSTAGQISFHDMPAFYKSVDAVLISSVTEGAGLPAREGAAAGRLVISTPVGDFPLRASQGLGIVAPIESHKYKKFVAETLKHYKNDPSAFADICQKAQHAARHLDWQYMIDDWIELIESAKGYLAGRASTQQGGTSAGILPEGSKLESRGGLNEGAVP
jgi:glycosyltransferase involved in cell wall biosynthesis